MPDDITVASSSTSPATSPRRCRSVSLEALLGRALTGLMVLLFLRDWRSSAIVVLTIPFALLAAVVALWGAGQTINLMTLGGLALAVGILVDEATVEIENIHTQLARGTPIARAVVDASGEAAVPRLLAMLCVLAVFVPSFFMTGVGALAVRAAVAGRRLRDDRVVPALEHARAGAVGLVAGGQRHHAAALRDRPLTTGSSACAARLARMPHANRCRCAWLARRRLRWSSPSASSPSSALTLGREIFPPSGAKAVPAPLPRAGGHQVRVDGAPRRATCST